jgi:DNA-binding beta-propeller fold protein YncE
MLGRVAGFVVVAAFWLALAAPASAHWGNPAPFGLGEFPKAVGITVDQSSGDAFVGNLFGAGILKFGPSHEKLSQFSAGSGWISGVAVNPANHDLYAVDAQAQEIQTYEPGGPSLISSFSVASAEAANIFNGKQIDVQIAADANGNVYMPNAPHNEVQVFGPEGGAPAGGVAAVIKGEGAHAISGPTGVAVDSSGHVWIADDGNNRLEEFEPNGEFVTEIAAVGVMAVAVDNAHGDVFASVEPESGAHVLEFNSTGEQIDDFGLGVLGEEKFGEPAVVLPNPIVLDETDGIFYAADPGHRVAWAFTPLGAETRAATSVTATSATLNGAIDPQEAPVTVCEFEYASGTEFEPEHLYTHKVACAQEPGALGSGNALVPVSAELTGLETDETYHFRLRASNESGQAFGADESFAAIEPVFGFQLSGPNALGMVVSNSANPSEPAGGNPADLDTQAGSHPFDVTTRFLINTKADRNLPSNLQAKDYYVDVPAGFAGSVAKIPRCKMSELSSLTNRQRPQGCATASQVGVIRLFQGPEAGGVETEPLPVYNMVPPPGVPAELAFPYILVSEPIVFELRPNALNGGYGITAKVRNVSEVKPIVGSQLTLWGVPADPAHDAERFLPERGASSNSVFRPGDAEGKPLPAGTAEVPFLSNPTKCGAQEDATITADSWLHPGKLGEDGRPVVGGEGWVSAQTPMFPNGITGCGKLTFHPEMEVKPEKTVADSPTGLTVDLRVPQSEGPNNLATPALKEAKVTLPQGLTISPSQANGLEGCTPAQIKLHSNAEPECPNASQVGKLELITPLLPEPLTGQIYISSERQGNTFHIYLVVEGQGVLVKLEGNVVANEQTGQLVSTFDENPQLPFSELKLTFYGGPRAALATPNACGSYQTASFFEPWSHDEANGEPTGTPDAEPGIEPFSITSGCVSGFAPGFKAGMENPVAGAYSPFFLHISREDGEQELSGVQIKMPQGLVGKLAGVEECSDAQIAHAEHDTGAAEKASASCPAGSQIGTVQTAAGPGEAPFYVSGKAYLTGPYKGAPYGVAVIVPALAGPFDLGTVVVRAAINIDPHTAQVTVTSDPLPRMLSGIPLKLRQIEVAVNRHDFTLNPTSCEQTTVTGNLESTQNAKHSASARFQVGDCASLKFKPGFKVSTKARHTKRFGAFLHVKVTSGPGQANIKSVLVKLPKQLPSRVATLKGACSEKQFEENPAGCPAASRVGTAIARTPILATPLTGPAMFVSHGGAAFPDLDIVLQGSGITVQLEGNTDIKHNITTSDFKSAPDVPIDSFELTLPTGPNSALSANGSFCFKTAVHHKHKTKKRIKLIMPTTITGHNGAVVKQNTVIAVAGCAKPRKHK